MGHAHRPLLPKQRHKDANRLVLSKPNSPTLCCAYTAGAGLPTFARALGEAHLQTLTIANCRLGDDFAAGLAEGSLLQGDHFTCLRLSACGISDEGACKLGRALERVGKCSSQQCG
ncbi:hypothetical protein DUNSADRAFT_6396 [Dunaliella salina]|uniref:Encoded protein n=1 Tax=Dunaliella salina TaxID=3046 RepID=A0ABQ7H6U0_DUNSA|nr:hypothetical protein DUNSADRAFT_6396 [Dunaliella salina]|eukprot:KAF5842546.1 hypothetical protein DUNSADRAFT_6396 [Dunaliella salina]